MSEGLRKCRVESLSPKIRFTPGVHAEVQSAIEPHLLKWGFLVPAWCHEVNVCWLDDDAGGALSVVVHYEYRRADLNVLPNFLSGQPNRRERQVVHELLHIVTEPMRNSTRDMRDVLAKEHPEMAGWADEMIRHSTESVTCDLTALVLGHLA